MSGIVKYVGCARVIHMDAAAAPCADTQTRDGPDRAMSAAGAQGQGMRTIRTIRTISKVLFFSSSGAEKDFSNLAGPRGGGELGLGLQVRYALFSQIVA